MCHVRGSPQKRIHSNSFGFFFLATGNPPIESPDRISYHFRSLFFCLVSLSELFIQIFLQLFVLLFSAFNSGKATVGGASCFLPKFFWLLRILSISHCIRSCYSFWLRLFRSADLFFSGWFSTQPKSKADEFKWRTFQRKLQEQFNRNCRECFQTLESSFFSGFSCCWLPLLSRRFPPNVSIRIPIWACNLAAQLEGFLH